jgi:hypothetical protein
MSTAPSDPAAWQRLAPYLDRALDLDSGERERWLAEIAITEPHVAAEVRRFLEEQVELDAKRFLEHSPIVPAAWPTSRPDFTGRQIGAYRVEELVGRGGMGEVWLASRADGRFEGRCAIKFLNRSISQPGVADRWTPARCRRANRTWFWNTCLERTSTVTAPRSHSTSKPVCAYS